MVDVNAKSTAEKIAAELVWRLEVLQHRSRYNTATGKYRTLPTRVRRFSTACPTDIVADVLAALVRQAPYTRVVFNGEDDPEVRYRPTMTMIRKDDSLKSTEGSKGTYTIVQDLLLEGELDMFRSGESSACSRVVTAERHWDEAEVVECPQGGQGVTFQVADVTRDKDTDLFSFTIRETHAITQHIPETVVECDEDKTVTLETWDNVYTDDTGAARVYKYDDVVHDGAAIDIPEPCADRSMGHLIQLEMSENEDCTLKISVKRTASKGDGNGVSSEYLRYRDLFKDRDVDLYSHVAPVQGDRSGVAYNAAAGTKTTIEVKDNEDGTVDRRVSVDTDHAVQDAERGETVMPKYREVTWTDKNQLAAASALPAGYAYGSWKCTKTDVGRYDNTFVGHQPIAASIGYQCDDTAFLHTHSEMRTLLAYPDPESCVPVAGGGRVTSYDVRTDDNGNITKTTQTRTEHPYESFRRIVSSTLLGRTVRVYSKSMAAPGAEPSEGTAATSEYQVTDGRLYDTVTETFVLNEGSVALAANCRRTVFEHRDETEATTRDFGGHVSEAGGGFTRGVTYAKDVNTGAIRMQEEVVEELAFEYAVVEKNATPRGTVTRVTNRNLRTVTAAQLLELYKGAGTQEQRQTNPGGSVDQVRISTTPNVGAVLSAECALTVTQHRHESEEVLPSGTPVSAGSSLSAGRGVVRKETVRVGDDNVATRQVQETREFDRKFGSRVHEDALQAHQVVEETSSQWNAGDPNGVGRTFNATEAGGEVGDVTPLPSGGGSMGGESFSTLAMSSRVKGRLGERFSDAKLVRGGDFQRGVQFVADSELTEGGRFHTKKTRYVAKPQAWLDSAFDDDSGGHYTWNFRNLTQGQVEDLVNDSLSKMVDRAALGSGISNHPFVRRQINDFGLYDGTCGFESRTAHSAGGGSGSGSSTGDNDPFDDLICTWKETDVKVTYVADEDGLASKTRAYVTTTVADWEYHVGRGKPSFGKSLGPVQFSYSATTQDYAYKKCTSVTVKSQYVSENGTTIDIPVPQTERT